MRWSEDCTMTASILSDPTCPPCSSGCHSIEWRPVLAPRRSSIKYFTSGHSIPLQPLACSIVLASSSPDLSYPIHSIDLLSMKVCKEMRISASQLLAGQIDLFPKAAPSIEQQSYMYNDFFQRLVQRCNEDLCIFL